MIIDRPHEVLIVGGGAIGLSLAYELATKGSRVRVVDRNSPGQESSWAGAGILPPAACRAGDHPLEQLMGLSHDLHPRWSQRLKSETGVDNGYLRCGGLYVARDAESLRQLQSFERDYRQRGMKADCLTPDRIADLEPNLSAGELTSACYLPDEAQIRNPRHVKALLAACGRLGVDIDSGLGVEDFEVRGGRIHSATAGGEVLLADRYCITSGAWTRPLVARLGFQPRIRPVRGQIALLNCRRPVLGRIVNDGSRYLVPRPDGRLLVGSTEEDAGFDKRTTAEAIGELLRFAIDLVPALAAASVERTWAGLRPGTADGLPYLSAVPGLDNAFVAAGHFRQGLHLSPATAVVMSQLILAEKPQFDLSPFRLDRE
jgi:glycine oxidase